MYISEILFTNDVVGDGLVQDCSNSNALTIKLLQFSPSHRFYENDGSFDKI